MGCPLSVGVDSSRWTAAPHRAPSLCDWVKGGRSWPRLAESEPRFAFHSAGCSQSCRAVTMKSSTGGWVNRFSKVVWLTGLESVTGTELGSYGTVDPPRLSPFLWCYVLIKPHFQKDHVVCDQYSPKLGGGAGVLRYNTTGPLIKLRSSETDPSAAKVHPPWNRSIQTTEAWF